MSRKNHETLDHRRPYDGYSGSHKVFSIAVVGLSGTEKDKGCLGVGKSCLCNRFVRPQADDYNRDHISVLSQTDFSGPIVNNEHWLYWGETRKATEEGFELTFSVVEQTEFVDDACFTPFRCGGGKSEPYYRRCAATKLSSAEKLAYICKNQLGVEKEYEQHYLPDGRFNVDGFVCVFDVSECQGREIGRQIELTALILSTLLKTKKPVVLATTKNDEVYHPYMREAERLVARREFKGLVPLVETSAHENVNVDLAFWACVQRDWTKGGRTKICSYQESFQRQRDRLEMVNDNYLSLIRSQITDYRTHWNNTYSNLLASSHDYLAYCDLFGQESAQATFKRHVKKLRDDYVCRRMQAYLRVLPKVLAALLPDLDAFGPDPQSWPAVQRTLQAHPLFESHFVVNGEGPGNSWADTEDSSETRIPFDLLSTAEAEKAFVDHREALRGEEHLRSLRHQFGELLRETALAPGQPLKEVRLLLAGRECVEALPEAELTLLYEDYQRLLQERAREQLQELLQERAALFLQYTTGAIVTQEDLAAISDKLAEDERWTVLELLPQDRDLALIRHLGFVQWPIKEHCPATAYGGCVDVNTEAFCGVLSARPRGGANRSQFWGGDSLETVRVKLKVLGSSGLAENLANVVKAMRATLEQENPRVLLDVQVCTDLETRGAAALLNSYPGSSATEPEAYVCVYSSRASLEVVRKSLEQSLLTDLAFGHGHHALGGVGASTGVGLPLVLLLASSADQGGGSAKERAYLREEGHSRAASLQCAFFDVTSDEPHARFKSDELLRALMFLSESVVRRADLLHSSVSGGYSPTSNHSASNQQQLIPEGALNPEIRILLVLMCGDPILPGHLLELLLLPHSPPGSALYPVSKHSVVADVGCLLAIDEDSLEDPPVPPHESESTPSRYVEFILTSYHGAHQFKEELMHGYIMVYWSKRQASFANMSALASTVVPLMMTPIQILALVENESRPSKLSHQLVADGQAIAQSLNANFRVSTMSHHMGRCISTFLNYALTNRLQIEKNFQMATAAAAAVVAQHQQQHSPGSTANNENDECYDPSTDPSFAPLLAAHSSLVHSPHQPPSTRHFPHHQLHHRSAELIASADSSIYERLPGEQVGPEKVAAAYQHGLPPHPPLLPQSLVRRTARSASGRHQGNRGGKSFDLDDEDEDGGGGREGGGGDSPSSFFTYEGGSGAQEEQLVKPSQIKQRRRMNYYNNLQSYPSADSLDRVAYHHQHSSGIGSIDSSAYSQQHQQQHHQNQQHYYANLAQLPQLQQHYRSSPSYHGGRNHPQSLEASFETPYGAPPSSFLDDNHQFQHHPHQQHFQHHPDYLHQLPPRPASSAHVMIPGSHHSIDHSQPPPYSRVAVSPPPAYKMGGSFDHHYRTEDEGSFYGDSHGPYGGLPGQEVFAESDYYHQQRKPLYGAPLPQIPPFRTYSPPFDPTTSSPLQYHSNQEAHFNLGHHQSLLRHGHHSHHPSHHPTAALGEQFSNVSTGVSYRHSPLLSYATTSRGHHARSSHFHQLGRTANTFYDPLLQQQPTLDDPSPYAASRSLHHHHRKEKKMKKKKKQHSSSSRSSSKTASSEHHRAHHRHSQHSSAADNDDDEDGDNEDNEAEDRGNEITGVTSGGEKSTASTSSHRSKVLGGGKSRKKTSSSSSKEAKRRSEISRGGTTAEIADTVTATTDEEEKTVASKTIENLSKTGSGIEQRDHGTKEQKKVEKKSSDVVQKKTGDDSDSEVDDDDEDEVLVDEELSGVESEEGDENAEEEEVELEEEDTVSSSNNSADDQLQLIDRYAVSSAGWAYHQSGNNNSSSNGTGGGGNNHAGQRHPLTEQWPPAQQFQQQQFPVDTTGEPDTGSLERGFKAPGKLDLNRFNNLSNAIGRLTLNSPGPLGPTRAAGTSFDGSDYRPSSRQKQNPSLDFSPEQLNIIATMGNNSRRGRGGGSAAMAAAAAAAAANKMSAAKGAAEGIAATGKVQNDNPHSGESGGEEESATTTSEAAPELQPSSNTINNSSSTFSTSKNLKTAMISSTGSKKQSSLQKNGGLGKHHQSRGRVVPVPVAPPRLPPSSNSTNNSTAATPTTSKSSFLMTGSSFEDSQADDSILSSSSKEPHSVKSSLDLEQGQLLQGSGEVAGGRRTASAAGRRGQLSKLFSLQSDHCPGDLELEHQGSNFLPDSISSLVSGGIAALEDAFGDSTSTTEKKQQVLKSKSIGAFAELENNASNKKASRKAEKAEKKRQKEEERRVRKASKEANNSAGARNRSRSKSTTNHNHNQNNSSSALEAFAQANGNAVPLFIEKCTRFIEAEGLDMEGIYRVPGNRAHVDTLLQQFDEKPDINITDLDIPVNAVATALKDFFMKRLPPIFPADCMEEIARLSRLYTDTGALSEMRTFLHRLPAANYQIIQFMIAHFAKVVEKSPVNSMDSKNLAICWWPTLLQFEFSDMFVFEQARPHLMNFVQIMIDSAAELFTSSKNQLFLFAMPSPATSEESELKTGGEVGDQSEKNAADSLLILMDTDDDDNIGDSEDASEDSSKDISPQPPATLNAVDVIRCPVCHSSAFHSEFTQSGITLALIFFPIGLLLCILLAEKRCQLCGYKA